MYHFSVYEHKMQIATTALHKCIFCCNCLWPNHNQQIDAAFLLIFHTCLNIDVYANVKQLERSMLPPILKDDLSIPVVGAPLFIISHPDLVIAQCKAGVVGSFPSLNARPIEQLDDEQPVRRQRQHQLQLRLS